MLDLNIPTFIFSAINLIVIYVILKKILFVPVSNFMEARKKNIVDSMNEAAAREETAQQTIREYEQRLRETDETAREIYAKAMEKAGIEHKKIIDDARREAERIKKDGYREIEKEREALSRDIKAQVTKLSIRIASKLIKANMDTDKNKALVEGFLSEEDVA
jgi:F-type H+-transporting ATPase subunit b